MHNSDNIEELKRRVEGYERALASGTLKERGADVVEGLLWKAKMSLKSFTVQPIESSLEYIQTSYERGKRTATTMEHSRYNNEKSQAHLRNIKADVVAYENILAGKDITENLLFLMQRVEQQAADLQVIHEQHCTPLVMQENNFLVLDVQLNYLRSMLQNHRLCQAAVAQAIADMRVDTKESKQEQAVSSA